MAGISASSSSATHDIIEILKKIQKVGYCLDLSISNSKPSQKKLNLYFNRILTVFQTEIEQPKKFRPVPALLGDGRVIDLFKLYLFVKEQGGFEAVTEGKAWAAVSEALGFDSGVKSCVKLVYVKYLDVLDKWFQKLLVKNEKGKVVCELRVEVNRLDPVKEDEVKGTPTKKNHFLTPTRDAGRRLNLDDGEKGDGVIVEAKKGSGSKKKRKRDAALVGMLDWVMKVARSPLDSIVGKILASDGGKDKGKLAIGRFYSQVLSARRAMFYKEMRVMVEDKDNPNFQKEQKMHPSMYEDMESDKSEKLRQSERLQPDLRSQSPSILDNEINNPDKKKQKKSNALSDIMVRLTPTAYCYEPVPVSSNFQANLPTYSDKSCYNRNNDLKWLGTEVWSQGKKHSQFKHDPVGKGRQDSCKCECPGSIGCIRFHVAERRFKLKNELGSAFHTWRFDCMGEEVALSWTEEESRRFKDVVNAYVSSPDNDLWDQLQLAFPLKEKKEIVSYYFNVFTLARRSYQNRVTPNDIDSDDDEEFGFLIIPFGQDAMKVIVPKANFCVQNTQCVDFDDD